MNIGMKMLWLAVTAALTGGGLATPVLADKLIAQKAISMEMANVMGMIGIPLGMLGCVVFFCLFFIE